MNEESGSCDGSTAQEGDRLRCEIADIMFVLSLEVDNQFLEVSSLKIKSRMSGSGTSDPDFMKDSACNPRRVLSLTLSRNKSPVLMEANWGYRRMSRSLCVPLPTPGAPTNIIRAASLSFLLPLETPILLEKPSGRWGTCRTAEAEKVGEAETIGRTMHMGRAQKLLDAA